MHQDIQSVLYSEQDIAARVAEMGAHITKHYEKAAQEGQGIVLACVLRGAAIFMADLARVIDLPVELDFLVVSSYGNQAKSSGVVSIHKDLATDIAGKHVIIVEDILDTGITLQFLVETLSTRNPASVEVVTLLRKQVEEGVQAPVSCLDVGFDCPDAFIVGYGLDYAQRYRNIPYIGVLKPEVYR